MHKVILYLFLAVSCCTNTIATAAITLPYSNDFSTSVADFTPKQSGQWLHVLGKYQNEILATAPNKSSSSMFQSSDLGGSPLTAKDFTISATFTITDSIGDFNFDCKNFSLHHITGNKTLTQKEAEVLTLLCKNKDRVLKREEILTTVWGDDDYFMGRSLDVFVSKLRKYLKDDPRVEIVNYHGVGFRLEVAR
jgi:hypothetical protein